METLHQKNDQQLVELYVSGNNEAFDCLLDRHKDRVYQYILQFVKQPDLADDVFQETFVKAIVNLQKGKYNNTGFFGAWLTQIAHNLVIDSYRRAGRIMFFDNEESHMSICEAALIAENNPEEGEAMYEQALRDVNLLIEKLPYEQREVILMRFFQNLSFKEIAQRTGVSINTSLGRMRYAIFNMRKLAQKHGISLHLN